MTLTEARRVLRDAGCRRSIVRLLMLTAVLAVPGASHAADTYGFKIYRVDSSVYPFVQVYLRTFDQDKEPLVNLNEMNIGLMVKGRSYDPGKRQYAIQSLKNREEATRSILILDASMSMKGVPFESALKSAASFIDSKRAQDEVAVLAIRDTSTGFEAVSGFERDPEALGRRLAEVRPDGRKTRLYDTIAEAMKMSGAASQGASQGGADYIASTSIIVFSDGEDDGSAISREELNARITSLPIPIPIYSVAYSNPTHFKNLEALSVNSFGKYYNVGTGYERMQRVVEDVQHILQNDYVVTFRSYAEVDGESHPFKLGIEYPSRSGKVTYESARFEAIESPQIPALIAARQKLEQQIKFDPKEDPYMLGPVGAGPPPGN